MQSGGERPMRTCGELAAGFKGTLTPTLSRKREREDCAIFALSCKRERADCATFALSRSREREGPAAKRWEGEGLPHTHTAHDGVPLIA
jgi:hypothetical protein